MLRVVEKLIQFMWMWYSWFQILIWVIDLPGRPLPTDISPNRELIQSRKVKSRLHPERNDDDDCNGDDYDDYDDDYDDYDNYDD